MRHGRNSQKRISQNQESLKTAVTEAGRREEEGPATFLHSSSSEMAAMWPAGLTGGSVPMHTASSPSLPQNTLALFGLDQHFSGPVIITVCVYIYINTVCVYRYIHTHMLWQYIYTHTFVYRKEGCVYVHSYACVIQNKAWKTPAILNLEGILKKKKENSNHWPFPTTKISFATHTLLKLRIWFPKTEFGFSDLSFQPSVPQYLTPGTAESLKHGRSNSSKSLRVVLERENPFVVRVR